MAFSRSIAISSSLLKQTLTKQSLSCGFVNIVSRSLSEYEVVIAGGGSGGISAGARLAKSLGKGKVAIIDPAEVSHEMPHYCSGRLYLDQQTNH